MNLITPYRVRIRFAKHEGLRFIGHLDLQRLFERALNRTGLPLRYSQGFSPKIRLNLASALPLGFVSSAEVLDFWLNCPVDLEEIKNSLQESLPKDIQILDIEEIDNKRPSLQASLSSSVYRISIPISYAHDELIKSFNALISQENIPFIRRKKTVDIKPMIEFYQFENTPEASVITLQMSSTAESNGRPDELLSLIKVDPADVIIERIQLIFEE
ncbi:MAG: DUF2344 domain-containing protein [Chloroflexi bacterium]|jgi:radical SAM-linked protein|nr:DUF2344 domain-containing protein [Chloroflexota bacterium]